MSPHRRLSLFGSRPPSVADEGVRDHSLFRTLLKTTSNGVLVIGEDGLILNYNDACTRLFQYAPEEVLGGPIDRLIAPSYIPILVDALRSIARGPRANAFRIERELQGVKKDGAYFPMQLIVGEGELDGQRVFISVVQDLTAQLRERTALDEEKAYLALIVESSLDAIISYRLDGTVVSWNHAAEAMFGYRADEIVGGSAMALMRLFVPPEQISREADILTRVLAGDCVPPHESVRYHKSGKPVQVLLAAAPIRDTSGAVVGIARTVRDITEQKKLEHEHALLHLAIEDSDDAFTCSALDGTNLTWNRGAEKMLGWKAGEVVGRNAAWIIPTIVPEHLQTEEFDHNCRAAAGEKIGPYETVRLHKDGSKVPVTSTVYPVRDAKSEVIAIARTLHNKSDRIALEQQRALLSAIVSNSTDAIISYALDGTITSWNRGAEVMYGYPADEMVGTSFYARIAEFLEPDQVMDERRTVARVIAGERVPPYEAVRIRRDGTSVHVLVSLSLVKDASGAIVGTSRVIRDITERRLLEQQKSLLSSVIESSNDAVLTTALNETITSWNSAAEAMFGYRAEEAVARSVLMLVPEELHQDTRATLARSLAGETVRHFETQRCCKDGSILAVSQTLAPLRDADGAVIGVTVTIRDLTDRKAAEYRLEAMREDLIHIARVHELGQVSAGIAHELNQPLTAMMNYANAVRRMTQNGTDLGKLPDIAVKISDQAERAAGIIRRMRDFVDKRQPQRDRVDIAAIAEDALALALIGSDATTIKTHFEHPAGLPSVMADRIQLQQVLVNLLRNAAEAMAKSDRRILHLSIQPQNDAIAIAVADTGSGISDDIAASLFSPFVTTKTHGMGIGLSISKSIIEAHGGSLSVEPNPGGGAIFRVTLPTFAA